METITAYRTTNDINGNSRYIIHFLVFFDYYRVDNLTRKLGLRKYNNKKFKGCYLIQSCNIEDDVNFLMQKLGKPHVNIEIRRLLKIS